MIPIFDLDDTLYPEIQFVESGFYAVSIYLGGLFGWSSRDVYSKLIECLKMEGRGTVFNQVLESYGVFNKKLVWRCLMIYRTHKPKIRIEPAARRCLAKLERKVYIVTDGHKYVQSNKINELKLSSFLEKAYITHRYGICKSKPSIYCFDLIRQKEKCKWSEMFYVGDNPAKDFVNLNSLGVHTIRVLTGCYAKIAAKPGFEAKTIIKSLDQLENVIK